MMPMKYFVTSHNREAQLSTLYGYDAVDQAS
jgi:hypothetical protein